MRRGVRFCAVNEAQAEPQRMARAGALIEDRDLSHFGVSEIWDCGGREVEGHFGFF